MSSTINPATTSESTSSKTFWQKLRALRPMQGQKFIWQLIDLQRSPIVQVVAFVGFLLSFRYLFAWTWSMSFAMILSMFLHECGHAAVFLWARIKIVILLLFPLGAVAAPRDPEQNAASDNLHWNTIAWLLQAGPAVNVTLMLIFHVLTPAFDRASDFGLILSQFSRDMVYVNGLLAIFNLVPVWTLDAGQLFKAIYSSLDEHEDKVITFGLLGGVIGLLLVISGLIGFTNWGTVLVNVLQRFGWVVFFVAFAFGIINKARTDNPDHANSHQAMTNRQVFLQLGVFFLLVFATLQIFAGKI